MRITLLTKLAGDRFMPGLHLRQTGFTYRGSRLFTKHHLRIIKIREAGDLRHLYRNK